jgi:hypothetical protein
MTPLPAHDARHRDALASAARRFRLSQEHLARLAALIEAARSAAPGCGVRLNTNQRTILSLRGRPSCWSLSVHVGMLDHPHALDEIPAWLRGRGRATSPVLRRALQEVWERQRSTLAAANGDLAVGLGLATLGGPLDLAGMFDHVHRTWFAHLAKPAIRWARSSARRHLTHIRFGSYRRKPSALVMVNPRLDQPWVARIFVEHVLHHELCHHAQACAPVSGESPHSSRFRSWERGYPHHAEALAWERANLQRLLSPP